MLTIGKYKISKTTTTTFKLELGLKVTILPVATADYRIQRYLATCTITDIVILK